MLVLNVSVDRLFQICHHKTPNTLVMFHFQTPGFKSLLFLVVDSFFWGILKLTPVEHNYYMITFHRYVCFNGVLYRTNCIFNYRLSYICHRTLQKFCLVENYGMIASKISVWFSHVVGWFFT